MCGCTRTEACEQQSEQVVEAQIATFVAANDRLHAFGRRSLHSGLRAHFQCGKNELFKFAPKGQA
jgi:hypothetical protein